MNAPSAVEFLSPRAAANDAVPARQLVSKPLPFSVRIVRNEDQLQRAVYIRAEAYNRHWPHLTPYLRVPEAQDRDPNSLIFLAQRKEDGEALGTMRIDTNLFGDLPITADPNVPEWIKAKPLAYVTRLGVKQGASGSLVKLLMFKALCRYCIAKQVSWILVAVRPPADRDYERLGFSDLVEDGKLIPHESAWGMPLRWMAFEIIASERRWKESNHPLYKFMFEDYHPDIEIFSSVSGMWSRPRLDIPALTGDAPMFDALGLPLI